MNHDPTRRTLLIITGATLTSASLAGCLSSATPSSTNENTSTDGSTPDETIHVGLGGNLMFDPDELEVQPGTTIRWVWDSNNHNVVVDHQPNDADWDGSPGSKSTLHGADFSFTHTFDVPGTYDYYSKPDLAAGMTGTVVVTRSPSETTTEESESPTESTEEENTPPKEPCSVTDLTGQSEVTIVVGPDGTLQFDPAAAKISRDTTVTWEWKSDAHNIIPESQPNGANWNGTLDGASELYDSGYRYSHTFKTSGTYEYSCTPHKSAGMLGKLIVE